MRDQVNHISPHLPSAHLNSFQLVSLSLSPLTSPLSPLTSHLSSLFFLFSPPTGWVFGQLLTVHCRHIKKNPVHLLGFESDISLGHGVKKKRKFHPALQSSFSRNITDPADYVIKRHSTEMKFYCVFIGLVLKLHHEQAGSTWDLSKAKVYEMLEYLPLNQFVCVGQQGVSLADFKKLEKCVFESSKVHEYFSFLRDYEGICLNIFRVQKVRLKSQVGSQFHLVPLYLSPNWRKNNFYSVDYLFDNACLWQNRSECHSDLTTGIVRDKAYHLLTLLNLPRLLYSFNRKYKSNTMRAGVNASTPCCRACLKIFKNQSEYFHHVKTCEIFGKTRCVTIKKPKNQIVHFSHKRHKVSGKLYKNTLHFQLKHGYHTVPPVIMAAVDFECSSSRISSSSSSSSNSSNQTTAAETVLPLNVVDEQTPLAVSLCFGSPYEIELPQTLSKVYVDFLTDKDTVQSFLMRLLLKLREKLFSVKEFLRENLSHDKTPKFQNLSLSDQIRHLTANACQLCGRRFRHYFMDKHTNKRCLVKRALHHLHFVRYDLLKKYLEI